MTSIEYVDRLVKKQHEDLVNEGSRGGQIEADLVIAADGSASFIRRILQPELKPKYTGYVAWRGTVLESDVP